MISTQPFVLICPAYQPCWSLHPLILIYIDIYACLQILLWSITFHLIHVNICSDLALMWLNFIHFNLCWFIFLFFNSVMVRTCLLLCYAWSGGFVLVLPDDICFCHSHIYAHAVLSCQFGPLFGISIFHNWTNWMVWIVLASLVQM